MTIGLTMRARWSLLFSVLLEISSGLVRSSVSQSLARTRIVVRSDVSKEEERTVLQVIESEASAQASRLKVSAATRKRLNGAVNERAKAENLLRKALLTAQEGLEVEAAASKERYEKSIQAVAEYRKRQVAKRQLAETERELIDSISGVVAMTPEPVIADRLKAVVKAKTEMSDVDESLAQVYAQAAERLEDVANAATNDAEQVEAALLAFPADFDDGNAIRAFDWSQVDAVITLLEDIDAREQAEKNETERLASVVASLSKRRSLAVAEGGGEKAGSTQGSTRSASKNAATTPIVGGIKTAASSVATVAGAAADWILSDKPEQIADTISSRFRPRKTQSSAAAVAQQSIPTKPEDKPADIQEELPVPPAEEEGPVETELEDEPQLPETEKETSLSIAEEEPVSPEPNDFVVAGKESTELDDLSTVLTEDDPAAEDPTSPMAIAEAVLPDTTASSPIITAEEDSLPKPMIEAIDNLDSMPAISSSSSTAIDDEAATTTKTKKKKKKTSKGFGSDSS